jgi:hypothetical protein
MARPKAEQPKPDRDFTRVPVRISPEQHDRLRELCLIRLRRPIEVVAGEWVAERLAVELKKLGR